MSGDYISQASNFMYDDEQPINERFYWALEIVHQNGSIEYKHEEYNSPEAAKEAKKHVTVPAGSKVKMVKCQDNDS